jgi:hypothetical protein
MTQPPPAAPGWYPDPSGTGSRYWDGNTWDPTAPPPPAVAPPRKKRRGLIILGTVVVVFIVLAAIGHNDSKQTSNAPASSASAPGRAAAPSTAGIGQEARDGRFAFVVTSIDRSKTAGDPSNEVETVTAQGEFVNVHLTVRNVGDQSQTFFASNQKLQIGDKQFDANGTAAMWIGSMTVEINPGNSIQAVASFDVPPNASAGGMTITVHDSAYSGGAKISLETSGR